jgi:hypothetical protein
LLGREARRSRQRPLHACFPVCLPLIDACLCPLLPSCIYLPACLRRSACPPVTAVSCMPTCLCLPASDARFCLPLHASAYLSLHAPAYA